MNQLMEKKEIEQKKIEVASQLRESESMSQLEREFNKKIVVEISFFL